MKFTVNNFPLCFGHFPFNIRIESLSSLQLNKTWIFAKQISERASVKQSQIGDDHNFSPLNKNSQTSLAPVNYSPDSNQMLSGL